MIYGEEIYKDRHNRIHMVPQAVIVPKRSTQTQIDHQGEGFNGETIYPWSRGVVRDNLDNYATIVASW